MNKWVSFEAGLLICLLHPRQGGSVGIFTLCLALHTRKVLFDVCGTAGGCSCLFATRKCTKQRLNSTDDTYSYRVYLWHDSPKIRDGKRTGPAQSEQPFRGSG
ncbi:hypothetical protein E4T44_08836 [Aureobasidium sp. EXF-8845]|nr:hypothetical protein E4T44_08836 [Aureobasidium sp. EXF-8845]KAI4843132.1 hypothetical protein E4T45_08755 [Aureobasidium sp. EXF-8846]